MISGLKMRPLSNAPTRWLTWVWRSPSVPSKRSDLHELHAGSRFGQFVRADALGAQVVRDHVEGFHLQLVEVDRSLDRMQPGRLYSLRRDGHAQARLTIDGHL